MKKQLLFLVMMLMPMVARAYDFEVDGFYYNITSLQELTVELTYGDVKYSGDVIIPSSVTYSNRVFAVNRLGDNVFKDCYDITSIDIPNTVVTTGAYTFYNCSNLTTLRIPFSMTDIGNSTACSNVGRYCFGGCWNLEHLVFDEGTENTLYIHPNDWYTGSIRTFVNCKLKSLYLGRNVSCTVLNSNGYYNPFYKQTELTEIQFGKDFNDIFSGMFEGCSSLKHIEIPDNVTTIGDYAFLDCTSLSELLLHEGLKNIGRNSFKNCKQIETLNFPSTLERINSEAFTNCTGINSVYCNSEVPCSMEENAFPGLVYLNATLYIPEGSKDLYLNANGWKDFANIVEKDVNGNDVESQQCEKPTISFINGEVVFSCETEGVEYVYKCMPPNSATSTTNDKFKPSSQYIITVYAKKAGYLDSEPTTAEIDIKGVKGDVNQDGEVTIADAVSVVNIILANNAATAPALQKPQENEEPK